MLTRQGTDLIIAYRYISVYISHRCSGISLPVRNHFSFFFINSCSWSICRTLDWEKYWQNPLDHRRFLYSSTDPGDQSSSHSSKITWECVNTSLFQTWITVKGRYLQMVWRNILFLSKLHKINIKQNKKIFKNENCVNKHTKTFKCTGTSFFLSIPTWFWPHMHIN